MSVDQLISNLLGRRVHSGFGLSSLQALVALLAAPPLLQQRHAGASHRDGHVDLRVRVAAAEAGARSLQDDGRSVDRSAAVLVALLPERSDQTALTQAVRLRDVAGIPGRVVGEPKIKKIKKRMLDAFYSLNQNYTFTANLLSDSHFSAAKIIYFTFTYKEIKIFPAARGYCNK